eukprot:CAMPEP_0119119970 /NCGR_PEP_ID=MMETSP1310-20130426/1228_1 /TAXON_ID=464262 /ORGANISM="Genus nov. species nov., Strain RCC2339" /LENGTH=143 /DNA_ID=CAMNT_0007109429 /DNA_START=112 /DNA_END=543 /DNA_ORIENTATION=-
MKLIAVGVLLVFASAVQAFDLEDYAVTYRQTRDAYLKAANAVPLARGPFDSGKDAYIHAVLTYIHSLYNRGDVLNSVYLPNDIAGNTATPANFHGDLLGLHHNNNLIDNCMPADDYLPYLDVFCNPENYIGDYADLLAATQQA